MFLGMTRGVFRLEAMGIATYIREATTCPLIEI